MATNTNKLMLSGIYQMGKTIRDNFSFIKLNDTPADYIPGKYIRVKNSADGLEYVDIEASSSEFDNYQDIFLSQHMNQAFLSGLYEGEAIHNYLYDINVDSNNTNGGTVLITESSYNFASVIYDQNINIQASVNDGYYFSHWDGSNVTFVDSSSESTQAYINKDTKITGYFTLGNPTPTPTSSSTPTPTPTPTLTPSSIPQNTEGNDSFPYTLPLQLS